MIVVGIDPGKTGGIVALKEDGSPLFWQKAVLTGVSGSDSKSRAFQVVRARVPDLELRPGKLRNPHSGLGDAACLALYGRRLRQEAGR